MRAILPCALMLALAATVTAQTGVADVEFDDQTTDGTFVIVQQVTLSNGGFVVIHDERLNMGDATGSVIGVSEYLGIGTHDDVRVDIDTGNGTPMQDDNMTLIAMAHFDTNGNQSYDFVTSAGEDDGPYTDTDGAVVDTARITVQRDTVGAGRDNGTTTDDGDAPAFEAVAMIAAIGAVALVAARRR